MHTEKIVKTKVKQDASGRVIRDMFSSVGTSDIF